MSRGTVRSSTGPSRSSTATEPSAAAAAAATSAPAAAYFSPDDEAPLPHSVGDAEYAHLSARAPQQLPTTDTNALLPSSSSAFGSLRAASTSGPEVMELGGLLLAFHYRLFKSGERQLPFKSDADRLRSDKAIDCLDSVATPAQLAIVTATGSARDEGEAHRTITAMEKLLVARLLAAYDKAGVLAPNMLKNFKPLGVCAVEDRLSKLPKLVQTALRETKLTDVERATLSSTVPASSSSSSSAPRANRKKPRGGAAAVKSKAAAPAASAAAKASAASGAAVAKKRGTGSAAGASPSAASGASLEAAEGSPRALAAASASAIESATAEVNVAAAAPAQQAAAPSVDAAPAASSPVAAAPAAAPKAGGLISGLSIMQSWLKPKLQ